MRDYRITYSRSGDGGGAVLFTILGIAMTFVAAWVTHMVWVIKVLASDKGATAGQMVLGAIGAFMPPVGVLHGFLIWFGVGA